MSRDFRARRLAGVLLALGASALLLACGGSGDAGDAGLSAEARLGEKIFFDASLSASGRQSCASCHDAARGHAAGNALPAQFGGPLGTLQGVRNTPGIRYLASNTAFFFDEEGTPTGGFFWDGRAASLAEQAGGPFLNPLEMANPDKASVIAKLAATAYAPEFKRVYGASVFGDVETAYLRLTEALQRYQLEDVEFNAFTSKYDAYLRGTAALSAQESRGLALFNSPTKGNCFACHPSAAGADGKPPLFTDFTYDNLGLPRNMALAANADPAYFDLGLCQRADLAGREDLCGAFKVPSLRNVALRQALFHNGVFTSLREAVQFYVQRDTQPEKWYPRRADGRVDKFNDLPAAYHGGVNTSEAPYDRQPGDAPALDEAEIDDLVAFLQTLTDGYRAPPEQP
ncbi:MAG: c-type cytochrome [Proteobacteria bacterium]|nr:c-type cytochrome [Burkholderiales bacterium]MCA0310849.1 c-type cytochrome [Pseudomonadota bacterium]